MALKIEKPQNLWGTLCLVKSLWFNKKKQEKTIFDSTEIFLPPKFYRTKISCRKIPPHFLLLTFPTLLGPIFAHSIHFFLAVCEFYSCYKSLSKNRDYRKLIIVKISPKYVHLFNLCQPIILNVSCCVLKYKSFFKRKKQISSCFFYFVSFLSLKLRVSE